MVFDLARGLDEVIALKPDWDDLAGNSLCPNPFYESWFAIPALRHLNVSKKLQIICSRDAAGKLAGFIPMEPVYGFHRLPLAYWRSWQHLHCFLGTPLIGKGAERCAFKDLMQWSESLNLFSLGAAISTTESAGDCMTALSQCTSENNCTIDRIYSSRRRAVNSVRSFDEYLESALSGKRRKELRQKEAALAKLGELKRICLHSEAETLPYLESFLCLEEAGWKGREGSALLSKPAEAAFAREAFAGGLREGKIVFHGIEVADKLIAARVSFLSGRELFGFKTAFDEKFNRYSPGMLLEVDVLKFVLEHQPPLRSDSCAAEDAELFRRLYREEKVLDTTLIAANKLFALSMVKSVQVLRAIARR